MRNRVTPSASASLLFLLAAAAACSSAGGTDVTHEYDASKASREPIIGGVKATAYPESALIDMYQGGQLSAACSGSVIAPRVVLTAGHCILGEDGWRVTTPFAGKQSQYATKADTTYKGQGGSVDPSSQDLGLIFLDSPITLPSYPTIQATKLPDGTQVVNVGRIDNGQFSSAYLSVGPAVAVSDGNNSGYPFDYATQEIIQSGDSGGPVLLTGPAPHTIVAVNSGAGGGEEVLARTDAVYAWIQQAIADHGGPGDTGGGGTGGNGGAGGSSGDPQGGSGGSGGGGPPDPPGGAAGSCSGGNGACVGTAEQEPNDSVAQAQGIDGAICGTLDTADDQDWFRWSVPAAGTKYTVAVAGDSAEILMWKRVNGQYYKIPNQTKKQISNTSNGAGDYFIAVWAPDGAIGHYKLTLGMN